MIFGDVIMAAIIGASAYLQAERRGWRNMIVGLTAFCLSAAFVAWWAMARGGVAGVMAGPDELKFKALAFCALVAALSVIGSLVGAVLARKLTPGKTGLAAFASGYLLINLIYILA